MHTPSNVINCQVVKKKGGKWKKNICKWKCIQVDQVISKLDCRRAPSLDG